MEIVEFSPEFNKLYFQGEKSTIKTSLVYILKFLRGYNEYIGEGFNFLYGMSDVNVTSIMA